MLSTKARWHVLVELGQSAWQAEVAPLRWYRGPHAALFYCSVQRVGRNACGSDLCPRRRHFNNVHQATAFVGTALRSDLPLQTIRMGGHGCPQARLPRRRLPHCANRLSGGQALPANRQLSVPSELDYTTMPRSTAVWATKSRPAGQARERARHLARLTFMNLTNRRVGTPCPSVSPR